MMNKEMTNGTVNAAEVEALVQEAATTSELMAMFIQLEVIASLDEDVQKTFFENYVKVAGSYSYSDDVSVDSITMRVTYDVAISCINDVVGTDSELFYDTLVKAGQSINNLECLDEDDKRILAVACPYFDMLYNKKGMEVTKSVLRTLKLFLAVCYNYIKEHSEQQ